MEGTESSDSGEAKLDGVTNKGKKSFVLGVVNTTGMKSVNANRKRRWDQPPPEEECVVPSKVVVREVDSNIASSDPEIAQDIIEESATSFNEQPIEEDGARDDAISNLSENVQDLPKSEGAGQTISSKDALSTISNANCTVDADDEVEPPVQGEHTAPSNLEDIPVPSDLEDIPVPSDLEDIPVPCDPEEIPVPAALEDIPVPPDLEDIPTPSENTSIKIISDDKAKLVCVSKEEAVEMEVSSSSEATVCKEVTRGKNEVKTKESTSPQANEVPSVKAIISDSLKQILCYDEDSNSSEEFSAEAKAEEVAPQVAINTVHLANKDSNINEVKVSKLIESDDQKNAVGDSLVTEERSEERIVKNKSRSPTPVLTEEFEEMEGSDLNAMQEDYVGALDRPRRSPVNDKVTKENGKKETSLAKETSIVDVDAETNVVVSSMDAIANSGDTAAKTAVESKLDVESYLLPSDDKVKPNDDGGATTPAVVQDSVENLEEKPTDEKVSINIDKLGERLPLNDVQPDELTRRDTNECRQTNDESRSPEESMDIPATVNKAIDKMDESNGRSNMDSTDNISEQCPDSVRMEMEESYEKSTFGLEHQSTDKLNAPGGQTNLVSMDNSQNCVGFGDLGSSEKSSAKTPELEARSSDSEGESENVQKAPSSEVTMHFASFRSQDNAQDICTKTDSERDIEGSKDESAMAIDALISANPGLSDKAAEEVEEEDMTTMEMLDSLVRRSSMDDPSRGKLGEGMLSEDSLINEINQLPDKDEEGKGGVLKSVGSEPEVKTTLPESTDEPKSGSDEKLVSQASSILDSEIEKPSTQNAALEVSNESKSEALGTKASKSEETADNPCVITSNDDKKQEGDAPVEEEVSQGGDEESKNVNVSSANILEVIFGSEQETSYPSISSLEPDKETKVVPKMSRKSKDKAEGKSSTSSCQNDNKKSADDSKLQLISEEIEIDRTETKVVPKMIRKSKDKVEGSSSTSSCQKDNKKSADNSKLQLISEAIEIDSSETKVILKTTRKSKDKIEGKSSTSPCEKGNNKSADDSKLQLINEEIEIDSAETKVVPKTTRKSKDEVVSKSSTSSCQKDNKKSADDSKLQLNNEEIEIDSTEIVMVDPTKPLSGEDTDNEGDEVPANKDVTDKEQNQDSSTADVQTSGTDATRIKEEPATSTEKVGKPSKKSLVEPPMNSFKETAMEVEESNSSNLPEEDRSSEKKADAEAMEVDDESQPPPAMSAAVSSALKKKESKPTPDREVSLAREPPVPVLIIKKQALPSKKEGDKNIVETLLTCSPKSSENTISESVSASHKKLPTDVIQVETAQEPGSIGSNSPKHSPITLRIYKDNLTVKTDLDSPKRNKSPLSSEFKSELSPHLRSPVASENTSPQNKQLEFTLKIAKDANTNYPKATMSPKNVASPTSVWKSEVQLAESPALPNKDMNDEKEVKTTVSVRGRARGGRARGGTTPKRGGSVRGGKRVVPLGKINITPDESPAKADKVAGSGVSISTLSTEVIIKQEVLTEDEKSEGSSAGGSQLGSQISNMFKKMLKKDDQDAASPEKLAKTRAKAPVEVPTPAPVQTPKKRGRPRKSVLTPIAVPEEVVVIKTEPTTPVDTALSVLEGNESPTDTPSGTGRPKRTCRGRTKPIVVKKRKPRGGGAAGAGVPRGTSTPLPSVAIKEEMSTPETPSATSATPAATPADLASPEVSTTPSTPATSVATSPPVEKILAPTPTPPARGRGGFKRPTPDRNTLSEKELAELQKIEAKKEKLRLDRIAKYEAKKAKKLAKKLKDEERRKRLAREKAEKAEAAAPQVFEEETRMSAPDSSSRGHTPAPTRIIITGESVLDESQNSISTPGDTNKGNKKGRMEISISDLDCLVKEVKVDELAEYQWQGSELFMIQEQVSLYLGVKSFKRKYPALKRRTVEAEERTFLEDSGLVPKSMCDLGITAVSSAEILDIMFQDFPERYEEFRKHVRDKQAREASFKQKAAIGLQKKDGTKVEPREQALEAVAAWNANLNRERREERKCALDLQTFTVHYPKVDRDNMRKPVSKVGLFPVAVIPGQFCDHYKKYTPTELMYFPVNTVVYGPLKPNERQRDNASDEGSGSESSSSSSSSSSSGDSSSESESEGEDAAKCKMCNGTKKKNKDALPEVLLCCVLCKSCYHPSCKEFTPEMTPHLVKYEWLCTACKKCSKCRDPNLMGDRIMCCQLCDRGYHLSCIGLKKMPEGRWHCSICAYCSSCGSRNPGGSDWQHEFKKGEKGIKIYQRTLCTPCFKLWRKGKYCQLCAKCHAAKPEEDPNLIQCNSCDRWLHKECYGSKYGIQSKLLSPSSIQCDLCVERIQSNLSSHGINRSLIKV